MGDLIRKVLGVNDLKVKTDEDGLPTGEVEAIVAAFDNVDKQGDRIIFGAFAPTLEEWRKKDMNIPMVWSHDWKNPMHLIGYWDPHQSQEIQKSDSTPGGLLLKGQVDIGKGNPVADWVHHLLMTRRIGKFSFAGKVLKEKRASDMANNLQVIDLVEAGPTFRGANDDVGLVTAKSLAEGELIELPLEEWNATQEQIRQLLKMHEESHYVPQPKDLGRAYVEVVPVLNWKDATKVDVSEFAGNDALSAATQSDNPAEAFAKICAGKTEGDPNTRSGWRLPHHNAPDAPPNRAGVASALGRLDQAPIVNKEEARQHLEAHQAVIDSLDKEGYFEKSGDSRARRQARRERLRQRRIEKRESVSKVSDEQLEEARMKLASLTLDVITLKTEGPGLGDHYHPHAGSHGPDPSGGGGVKAQPAVGNKSGRGPAPQAKAAVKEPTAADVPDGEQDKKKARALDNLIDASDAAREVAQNMQAGIAPNSSKLASIVSALDMVLESKAQVEEDSDIWDDLDLLANELEDARANGEDYPEAGNFLMAFRQVEREQLIESDSGEDDPQAMQEDVQAAADEIGEPVLNPETGDVVMPNFRFVTDPEEQKKYLDPKGVSGLQKGVAHSFTAEGKTVLYAANPADPSQVGPPVDGMLERGNVVDIEEGLEQYQSRLAWQNDGEYRKNYLELGGDEEALNESNEAIESSIKRMQEWLKKNKPRPKSFNQIQRETKAPKGASFNRRTSARQRREEQEGR